MGACCHRGVAATLTREWHGRLHVTLAGMAELRPLNEDERRLVDFMLTAPIECRVRNTRAGGSDRYRRFSSSGGFSSSAL